MATVHDCVSLTIGTSAVDLSVLTNLTGTEIGVDAAPSQIMITLAAEQIGLADAWTHGFVQIVVEQIGAGSAFTQVATTTNRIAEVIGMAAVMRHIVQQRVEQGAGVTAVAMQSEPQDIIHQYVGLLTEHKAVLMHRLAEAIGVRPDLAAPIIATLLADGVGVADVARPLLTAIQRIAESVGTQSLVTARATVTMLVEEGCITADAATQVLIAINKLAEEVGAAGRLLDNRPTTSWTVPAETMAMSRYEHPELEGMAGTDQGMLAIGPQGLYLLTQGQPDHGANPVRGRVVSGKVDMINLHRPSYAYVHRAAGQLNMLISEFSTAAEIEHAYPTVEPFGAELRPTRVSLGRGIRSRSFRLGFENIDGADFRVQTIVWPLDPTSRKV